MARIITKELAVKIIKKLDATKVASGGAHDQYQITDFQGRVVAVTSVRHGSNKELGHDHMPDDLHLGPSKTKSLGQCNISRKQFIAILQEQGDAEAEPDPPE
jgi:hypothetical protein